MFGLVRPTQTPTRTQPALDRWDPWADMERARREMDDLVTRAFGFTPFNRLWDGVQAAAPPVELYETAEAFRLRVHLPGMSREDINLEVAENRVSVWGEHRTQGPAEDAKVHLNTAGYGRFRLDYELPVSVKTEEVQASYRDGILEVELPKVEVDRPKSIKVDIQG